MNSYDLDLFNVAVVVVALPGFIALVVLVGVVLEWRDKRRRRR